MILRLVCCFIISLFSLLEADIVSTKGQIRFDVLGDGEAEMILNTNGLGVGITPTTNLQVQGDLIVSDQLSIGGQSGGDNLNVQGTTGYSIESFSTDSVLGENTMVIADSSNQDLVLTLPYSSNVKNRVYHIKKKSSNNSVTVHGENDTIDDRGYWVLSSGNKGHIEVISDGSAWYILSQSEDLSTWSPSFVTTSLWLDASDASSLQAGATGNVYQWNDKSGNGKHAIQNSSSLQPTSNTNELNDLNVLAFDGSDRLESGDAAYWNRSSMNLILVTVLQHTGSTAFRAFVGAKDSSNGLVFPDHATTNNKFRVNTRSTPSYDSGSVGDSTTVTVFSSRITETSMTLRVNGTEVDHATFASATPAVNNNSPLYIGNRDSSSGDLDGVMAEMVIIKDGDISLDTLEKIEGYLSWKWGLEGDLDASHPFKNYSP